MEALHIRQALAVLMVLGAFSTISLNLKAQKGPSPPPADNTRFNQLARSITAPVADQGKNNLSDRHLMQKIRRSLMDDKSLSISARNVKIVAQNGEVTLTGPVASEEEKCVVEEKATEIAGSGNVGNEMSVKPAPVKKIKPTS